MWACHRQLRCKQWESNYLGNLTSDLLTQCFGKAVHIFLHQPPVHTHQDSDAGESADSDGEVRERGGAEDLCEDEQRGREVVRRWLEQQQCGGRGLNRRERHGTDCALERSLLKYRGAVEIVEISMKSTAIEEYSNSPFLCLLLISALNDTNFLYH